MSRHTIAWENKMLSPHDVVILPGALRMLDERVPVSFSFDHKTIGWASDMQVGEDGEISVEIELSNADARTLLDSSDVEANLYACPVSIQKQDGYRELLDGRLREVGLTLPAGLWTTPPPKP